jgi:Mn-dependent DtxR family transcriptional regulator
VGGSPKEVTVSEDPSEELKQKVLQYLESVTKAKNREVARALGEDKSVVDKVIADLAKDDKIEYVYLGASFIKLKGK